MARNAWVPALFRYNPAMAIAILSFLLAFLTILTLLVLNSFRRQRAAIRRISQFISNVAQGEYARRTEVWAGGAAQDLARSANSLSEDLENRQGRAQQDKDHLFSIPRTPGSHQRNRSGHRQSRHHSPGQCRRRPHARAARRCPPGPAHRNRHFSRRFARTLSPGLLLPEARLHAGGHPDARPHPPLPGDRRGHLQPWPLPRNAVSPCGM